MKKVFLVFLMLALSSFFFAPKASSDQLDDLNKQINDLTSALNMSVNATKPLESELRILQNQIKQIKDRVFSIETDISQKKKVIDNGYKNLAKQELILNKTIRDFYMKSYLNSPLLIFLSAHTASNMTQLLAYQKAATDQDKLIITNIVLSISDLENKKRNLEEEQKRLTVIKANLDEQSQKLDKIVTGAKAYQINLSNQIAQLSAKQQELLAQKLGSLNLPKSAYTTQGGCSSDMKNGKDPGFSGGFGFFTYGVPHRVGMNQYGAKGRAEAGDSFDKILSFYFPNTQLTTASTSTNIHVTGTNEYGQSFDDNWSIEDYVKHIYEMPTAWPANALKAQAIAARSYALATTNNGANTICPSQSCQVVKKELNSDTWVQAVNDTAGQILTNGGNPVQAWFSSTAGGYTFGSGDVWGGGNKDWTKNSLDASGSVGSFSDLQNNAYDKDSPWFYCDWGARSQYSGTAWLKSEEVADIVNVLLLAQADSGTQKHLSQVDKPNPDGVDTWDAARVRQELSKYRAPFNSISGISVSANFSTGVVNTVSVSGDAEPASFSGSDFKTYFNLRAPANINIVGPLYNVERH
ncbi:MAG: SpoIID/LytB domain-containing protein [Candidatus Levybacteria bacterium]|nr:SpoIID/LytB domain-containing protein [Candidatus Levybacteria bacterium]